MTAWLLLGCLAGLRCKEIAGLRPEHVTGPMIFVADGKGGHQREVPMHPRVRAALDAYGLPESGPVFPIKGVAPKPGTVSAYINQWLRTFGVAKGAHRLRHTFGTSIYRATKDLRLTQELMGHADPATTALYTQVDSPDAAAAVALLDDRLVSPMGDISERMDS